MAEYLLGVLCVEVALLTWLCRGSFVRFDKVLHAIGSLLRSECLNTQNISNYTKEVKEFIDDLVQKKGA